MKKTIFLLLLPIFALLFSCKSSNETAVDLIFEQTSKIEILAYVDRNLWDEEDNPEYYKLDFIKNKKVKIKDKYLKNRILLNEIQLKKLQEKFYGCKSPDESAACFDPRHALIFYDKKNEVLGYIEICFQCNQHNASLNLETIADCALNLEALFKEFGITYFNEEQTNF